MMEMHSIFFAVSVLLAIGMFAGDLQLKKVTHPASGLMRRLFLLSCIVILTNAASAVTESKWFYELSHGIYLAFTDWVILAALRFAWGFSHREGRSPFFRIFQILFALDTFSMVLNTWTHHVFVGELALYEKIGLTYYRMNIQTEVPIYYFHLVVVYGVAFYVIGLFILQAKNAVPLYRGKYIMVCASGIAVFIGNIICRILQSTADFSSLLYALLSVSFCYFTIFYSSKKLSSKLLSFSIEDMQNGILCFDREGNCIYANAEGRLIFGGEKDISKLERVYSEWKGDREVSDLTETSWHDTYLVGEEERFFDVQFKPLINNRGNYIGGFFSMTDRTEERKRLAEEHYQATHDPLTGMYNRKRFLERVREILNEDPDSERLMVCTDIKDFKMVNGLFGEETGNQILCEFAKMIQSAPMQDIVYGRLESDRFAMCMRAEDFDEEYSVRYLEKLRKLINSSVYRMHFHMGVYHITDPAVEVSVMCDRAIMAISDIKSSYEKVVSHYSDKMGRMVQREKVMVGEFERALAAGEFQIYLQAQVSTEQELLGAEALVRWNHPVRGMVSPAEFITVFEKSGHIHRLDSYVWEQACIRLAQWKKMGREDLHISVNISPIDFYFINIYDTVTKLVEKYNICPQNLKLEITETALMAELNQQQDLLEKLRAYGFCVEIDDFGSGYSSLNVLKDIKFDVLKVDMGFLQKSKYEERGKTITSHVISMAKNLGLTVITEGVETLEQVSYLIEAGCDMFQGYYFARPMPVQAFEEKYTLTNSAS